LGIGARDQKAPMMGLPDGGKVIRWFSHLDTIPGVTDGRTDGHVAVAKTAVCYASRA